jgi:hypothetical protein
MSVGVMKDYKLKLRNLRTSYTLGWSWNWNTQTEMETRLVDEKFPNTMGEYVNTGYPIDMLFMMNR